MRLSYVVVLVMLTTILSAQDKAIPADSNGVPQTQKKIECVPPINLFFTGEWLYWNTRQGGMQYATEYNPVNGDMADAHTKNINFGWNSGWRLGGGVDLYSHDRWHFYSSYTVFNAKANRSTRGVLFPYLMYQGQGGFLIQATVVDEASAQWEIDFQTWNIEMGRKCLLSDVFSLRPYAGIKGASIDQHAQIQYTGGPSTPPGGEYNIHLDQKFDGFGVRGGLDSIWRLFRGFGLSGSLSGALLWGTFDVTQDQILLTLPVISWKDLIRSMVPMMQALIKLSWDHSFLKNKCNIGIHASLETQYWWQQNITERFVDALLPVSVKTKEDLGFYGLSLGGRFDF